MVGNLARISGGMVKFITAYKEIHGSYDAEIWSGDPAETILRVIEANSIDLINMGAQGRGSTRRLLLGS